MLGAVAGLGLRGVLFYCGLKADLLPLPTEIHRVVGVVGLQREHNEIVITVALR